MKNEFIKLSEKIFYIYFIFFNFLFLFFYWILNLHYSLFFGYSIGALVAFFIYKIRVITSYFIFKQSKKSAWLSSLLIYFSLIFFILIIVYLIFKINYLSANPHVDSWDEYVYKPINLFTFLFGFHSFFLSILTASVIRSFATRKGV
ncbi:hypothetical protein C4M96_01250 [Mycoplasmopsis pullorum]|uniref:Uncharacterized protein n=1 Tax=Mycoplasmopsis pullorum TaxID=48003 RepID=A0A1L4FRL1_9BACT|nr:hypothetical protein BLA55_00895 [Mycoplasmopsis pullorum]TNK83878.1 hypothetical protein C4M93_00855 [Mycoplasmopsis pullorum]TNK92322.1 hypothetical protein C4M96_01250 [Mycoplasmopsis pullorum]